MRIRCREILTAGTILTLLTHSLPLAPLQVDNSRIERRRISYSVVPVHGNFDTSSDAPQVVVTVAGVPPPPVTITVTVSGSEKTVFPHTPTSFETDPVATSTDTRTISSAIQPSSTSAFVEPSPHTTSSSHPSRGFSMPYATPTSMKFYSPTLPPVIV